MKITREEINHLATLSNFSLEDAEAEALGKDLNQIIETFQVFEMENVWREDEIKPQEADREALLALAPEAADNQIKVPKVL